MAQTVLLKLYSLAMRAASPLLPAYLKRRAAAGKEDPARMNERYGHASAPRPDGPLIWIHGASVGETMMAVPITQHLLSAVPNASVLVTSGTVTSAKMLAERLPQGRAFHHYLPADVPPFTERFLGHWQPDLCLWLESEIWPNTLRAAKNRGVPLLLLNARLSEKSRTGWEVRPKTAKAVFGLFDDIMPADDVTAASLSQILGADIPVFGNLKMGSPPLPVDEGALQAIQKSFETDQIWCAASTHEGEDEVMLKAHAKVLETCPHAKLILAPRHPERADDVIKLITAQGLSYTKWGKPITEADCVYLIDRIGKLGTAYSLAKLVFMGGSIFSHLNGHNLALSAQFMTAFSVPRPPVALTTQTPLNWGLISRV